MIKSVLVFIHVGDSLQRNLSGVVDHYLTRSYSEEEINSLY